jgi:hypothetical protein
VSDLNGHHDIRNPGEAPSGRRVTGEDSSSVAVPTQNGKSSGLGKRKHQHDAAEQTGQTPKKTRSGEQEQVGGASGRVNFAAPKVESDEQQSIPFTAPQATDKPRPKGDSNYRQKKKKGRQSDVKPRRDAASHEEQAVSFTGELQGPSESGPTLPSTETYQALPPVTPKPANKLLRNASLEDSPTRTDRRKSVTFTPDTKTVDGNSASNLFKKWVAEQKGAQADFTEAEVAQFAPPPKVHPANGIPTSQPPAANQDDEQHVKAEKKAKKKQKKADSAASVEPGQSTATAKPKGKKKDPSLYLAYLTQFHKDNSNWKFNKAKQNDVLENALNIFRIPDEHSEALYAYVKGLKGAAVIERLKARCQATLKELDEEDQKDPEMNDQEARKKAKDEALEERLAKERKRRRTEADVETLLDHPHPEGFVRRLKRQRAEALLNALNLAAPLAPPPPAQVNGASKPEPAAPSVAQPQRTTRKRKSRTEVSSDESSSDSSEDSPSSDESDDDESASSTSDTSDSEASGSDSDSTNKSGSSSGSGSDDSSNDSD